MTSDLRSQKNRKHGTKHIREILLVHKGLDLGLKRGNQLSIQNDVTSPYQGHRVGDRFSFTRCAGY